MGELIDLRPTQEYSLVIKVLRTGYHAIWYHQQEIMWEYETEDSNELLTFATTMIGRMDDPGTPLPSA